jgi:hypothetical protein
LNDIGKAAECFADTIIPSEKIVLQITERDLLIALYLFVSTDPEKENAIVLDTQDESYRQTLKDIKDMLVHCGDKKLNVMFDRLHVQHPAKKYWNEYKLANEKIRTAARENVLSGLDFANYKSV